MDGLRNLAARIDALSVRERGLIMLTVLVGIYILWDFALMRPLESRKAALDERMQQTRNEIQQISSEANEIVRRFGEDPDAHNRERLAALDQQLTQVQAELEAATSHLVKPEDMSSVLESVLKQSAPESFVGLSGTGVSPLVSVEQETAGAGADEQMQGLRGAYKHGFSLQLRAGYLETLSILENLEALPWSFFWDRVDFQVNEYPDSTVTVEIFTLSWERNWIGV